MRSCYKKASLLVLCLLAGCATGGTGAPAVQVHPLERNAINALSHARPGQAGKDLDLALTEYEREDDLYGQWRIHFLKARLALANGDAVSARQDVDAMSVLAPQINGHDVRFATRLARARVTGERADFRQALAAAGNDLQRAVAETYLGNTKTAIERLDAAATDHPADRAFIFYRRARDTGDPTLMHRALDYYRAAGDSRGVADALTSLAHWSARQGELQDARRYAGRAISVLAASGDHQRADALGAWLDSL